ncbi:phosphotransferase family protein [Sandaracinobacteroides saxicola]|uniref:Phosphotransferase family protein n=1 Tax=Sandaracinobacteroides saxicola TaxID=2759707 RepID=A0A7G5IEM9_9SPHN|nr:phosphotransferase family protein [Sandaracinobacteroides saxicola]QMW21821.1 phosphotransferase family protein [Sandaracinobacteroides saxicola]
MSGVPEPAAVNAALVRAGVAARVTAVVPLSGGASSATYRLETEGAPLILQTAAAGTVSPGGLGRATMVAVAARAGALGLPVAPLLAVLVAEDGLGDGAVTGFVEGEALAPRWLKRAEYAQARAALTGQCAAALARLHRAPLEHWEGLALAGGSGAEQLERSFALYRLLGVDVPAFDLAFAWLKPRMPTAPARCLVHGDFRSGNLLIDQAGLAAVLDWELTHLSEPAEDLGWMCVNAWRFGVWDRPVGGFGTREELLAAYAAAGGDQIAPETLHLWEVFGNLKWGLSCLQLAHDHVSGRVRSVERAAIGRRVSEVSADLLHLVRHGDL